jgi:hypothetical protein
LKPLLNLQQKALKRKPRENRMKSRLTKDNPHIVKKGTKVSAASVAKEAGVDRVTLYRFHEPILIEIRKLNDSTPRAQLKESRSELTQTAAKLKEYRTLIEDAQEEVVALARIN